MKRKQAPHLRLVEGVYVLGRISLEQAIEHAHAQIEGELEETLEEAFPSLREGPGTCDFACQPPEERTPLIIEDVASPPIPTFEEQVAALRGIRHTYVLLVPKGTTQQLRTNPHVHYVNENTVIATRDRIPLFVYSCQNALNRHLVLSFPEQDVNRFLQTNGGLPRAGVDVIFVSSTLTHGGRGYATTVDCFPGVTSFGYIQPSGVKNVGIVGIAYLNPQIVDEIRETRIVYDSR